MVALESPSFSIKKVARVGSLLMKFKISRRNETHPSSNGHQTKVNQNGRQRGDGLFKTRQGFFLYNRILLLNNHYVKEAVGSEA